MTEHDTSPKDSESRIESIFADYLGRLERREHVTIDDLCSEYPDVADHLRRYEQDRLEFEGEFGGAFGDPLFFGQRSAEPPRACGFQVETGTQLGDYRLIRYIDGGGMGQIWEAEQVSLNRHVALKLVRPDRITEKRLELFAREARAGGRLHHPGIVGVHAHGESKGVAWIAMELVEGCWTLRDFLGETAKRKVLDPAYYREVAAFVGKLADALHTAHEAGVIHRDLKPQNVLITPENEPKVTDFGLARITDEPALSVTGDVAGTYFYMSPEQVAAKRTGLDHRTDVFSLGVVLYEMLALRRPFEGDTTHQVAHQILQKDPPELRSLRSRIPRDLEVTCGKCLEKDRDRRDTTMEELAADLSRYLNHEPVHARPPGRVRRAWLWTRRNPTRSAGGGISVVAFVAISLLLGENVRANRELSEQCH